MNRPAFALALILLLPCSAAATTTGLLKDVVFSHDSTLASSDELARRLLSPFEAMRVQVHGESKQTLSLKQERFAMYVPAREPPNGYALLVFIPPWDQAEVPPRWVGVLERRGIILVTAAHSGNDASAFDQRAALAVLAATNVMALYHVDPQRVYVSGFSGGSRMAMRLALGYPDLFHGALLDAGSDAIGDVIPPPPKPLLEQFQTSSRLVYLTGEQDRFHLDMDSQSRHSLPEWCITDVETVTMPWLGHELAEPPALEHALVVLEQHHPQAPDKLKACRSRLAQALNAQLDQAQQWMQNGKTEQALRLLRHIDTHYGGLAAPRSVELATQH
ncbi:MAG TPA: PHB depolymerase family esterase [Dyella sp.]|uniref:PHB depolymerase family esterase n=1 Tax=Dyella sp. TaxID=1869338 RepID=UPI002BDB2763|nr:PHB depolymerase family esterase [Dyella sp.]HUB91649.1 PHB depolymerase family esterase [Dyella sp.]